MNQTTHYLEVKRVYIYVFLLCILAVFKQLGKNALPPPPIYHVSSAEDTGAHSGSCQPLSHPNKREKMVSGCYSSI